MKLFSLLAVDSSMSVCSAGIYNAETDQIYTRTEEAARGQAEFLVPLIEEVMGKAGLSYKDLDFIVSTIGPGSFTGLRVGLSAAKALALCLNIPILEFETHKALAMQFFCENDLKDDQQLCVLVETRREDFYVQFYDSSGEALGPVKSAYYDEICQEIQGQNTVFIGNAAGRFQKMQKNTEKGWFFKNDYHYPDLQTLIDFVKGEGVVDGGKAYKDVHPLYLREASVSQPKQGLRELG